MYIFYLHCPLVAYRAVLIVSLTWAKPLPEATAGPVARVPPARVPLIRSGSRHRSIRGPLLKMQY